MGAFRNWWNEYRSWRRLRRLEKAIARGPFADAYHDWKQYMIEKGLWK